MPSPFPGMDPYLEDAKRWPAFHHQFVATLYQLLLPGLVDRYRARVLTRETVSKLYRIAPERIADFVEFDPANAIKFTIYRSRPSGSPGDPDIFGAQQYAPLLDIEVPFE